VGKPREARYLAQPPSFGTTARQKPKDQHRTLDRLRPLASIIAHYLTIIAISHIVDNS
jgi:hypothetical protein